MNNTERSFYAGMVIVCADMAIYGWRGLPSGWGDLLFHAMPMCLGFALMVPKLFPGLMLTVQQVFGKWKSMP